MQFWKLFIYLSLISQYFRFNFCTNYVKNIIASFKKLLKISMWIIYWCPVKETSKFVLKAINQSSAFWGKKWKAFLSTHNQSARTRAFFILLNSTSITTSSNERIFCEMFIFPKILETTKITQQNCRLLMLGLFFTRNIPTCAACKV